MKQIQALAAAALLALAGAAQAQLTPEQAESVVETRQALLRLVYWNFGPMGAMARDRIEFDAERVQKNAERLQGLLRMMSDAFAPDTRGHDLATDALDGIWADPDDFAAKVQAAIDASDALVNAAGTGDEAAMRSAIAEVSSTCGSCHDSYKAD